MKQPVRDYRKMNLSNITSEEYRHMLLLLGWLGYLIMFYLTEKMIPQSRCHVVHSFVDDLIPFNEYFIIFYISWFIYLVASLTYFGFYDIKSFVRAEKVIVGMQIISIATYIMWPSVQYLRPEHFAHENIFTALVGFFYAIDTPTGVCPSIHVGYTLAILPAWLHREETPVWKKVLIALWAFCICISVCFVKQHSFTDVLAGCALFLVLDALLFGREKLRAYHGVEKI